MAEISEKSFPFDSDEIDGKYDREYFAEDWARYFAAFISSGTFLREPTNLQIIANGDMSVTLKPGSMMIDGTRYDNVADIVIQLEPADGVLSRIDRISITWSKSERDTHYTLQKGIMSYNPVPPECRRNAEYKDYVVADIRIDAGVISINQSTITDQRLNSEVCGVAIPFAYINTESLALQLQAFYEETMDKQAVWEQDMQEQIYQWFQDVQDQLSSDVAFNLQKQIGRLAELKTENKDNLVTAINEVKTSIPIPIANMLATEEGNPLDAVIGKELKDLHDANAEEITKLNGNLKNYIKVKTFNWRYEWEGLGFAYKEITGIKMDGYTPIGVVGYSTGNSAILSAQFGIFGETLGYWFRNITTSTITATASVSVMFIKNL